MLIQEVAGNWNKMAYGNLSGALKRSQSCKPHAKLQLIRMNLLWRLILR